MPAIPWKKSQLELAIKNLPLRNISTRGWTSLPLWVRHGSFKSHREKVTQQPWEAGWRCNLSWVSAKQVGCWQPVCHLAKSSAGNVVTSCKRWHLVKLYVPMDEGKEPIDLRNSLPQDRIVSGFKSNIKRTLVAKRESSLYPTSCSTY